MKVSVVVGNPKPASRTLDAALLVAEAMSGAEPDLVIDVALIAPRLLGWGDEEIKSMVRAVGASDLVVVASPTYKATYTGVLKLFLDQFPGGTGLAGTVTLPLMLGAGPGHALAPETTLKPVLAELGAATALPGLYLLDSAFRDSSEIDDYAARWSPTVAALASAALHPTTPPSGG